jgi:hypothetical protein
MQGLRSYTEISIKELQFTLLYKGHTDVQQLMTLATDKNLSLHVENASEQITVSLDPKVFQMSQMP